MCKKKKKIDLSSFDSSPFSVADAFDIARVSAPRGTENPSTCATSVRTEILNRSPVRISLEKKGHAGKTVTVVSGLRAGNALNELVRNLKGELGCGATIEKERVCFQGDQRERLLASLRRRKFSDVKSS